MYKQAFTLSCKAHSSEGSTPHSPEALRARAFTLAEVLITLAIIGIVAALTIPAVVTKATKQRYVTSLRKAYNTLKQAEREAVQKNGDMTNWVWSGNSKVLFERYFDGVFDIAKVCGIKTDDGCFAQEYKTITGDPSIVGTNINREDYHYRFVTADGISYSYVNNGASDPYYRKAEFYVDINGVSPPNTIGRDLFVFSIYPPIGLKPNGAHPINDYRALESPAFIARDCNPSSANSNGGYSCAAKVLSEGAMNY